jgi:hypothetical protein
MGTAGRSFAVHPGPRPVWEIGSSLPPEVGNSVRAKSGGLGGS